MISQGRFHFDWHEWTLYKPYPQTSGVILDGNIVKSVCYNSTTSWEITIPITWTKYKSCSHCKIVIWKSRNWRQLYSRQDETRTKSNIVETLYWVALNNYVHIQYEHFHVSRGWVCATHRLYCTGGRSHRIAVYQILQGYHQVGICII